MKEKSISFYLDVRRALTGGGYPLKIAVYHNKKQCYIKTDYHFTPEQWTIIQDRSIRKNKEFDSLPKNNDSEKVLSEIREEIDTSFNNVVKAYDLLSAKGVPFSANDVKDELNKKKYEVSDLQFIENCHKEYLVRLERKQSSPSTINGYKSIISMLKNYYEKLSRRNSFSKLRFSQIDYDFLQGYRKHLVDIGDTEATISAHNRYLKALFNFAIAKEAIPKEIYPYGKADGQITIRTISKTKKALTKEELKKIVAYRSKLKPRQLRNFDLAILSFLMNGANMLDIAKLKYKENYDVNSKTIHFAREKTYKNNNSITEVTIYVTNDIQAMINLYGNPNEPNNYIFNILRPDDISAEKIRNRVKNTTRAIDKTLKRVAKSCGIREDISYQFFRHTHATFSIKEAKAGIYEIMVSMGHKNIKTTAQYIQSLPDEGDNEMTKAKKELLKGIYQQ